jgi:hypothetical protein
MITACEGIRMCKAKAAIHSGNLLTVLKTILQDPCIFAEQGAGLRLRNYQREVANAIATSAIDGQGLSFVVMFPRQSGKNELQAQIEAYLLTLLSKEPAEIIKVSPTWKPQSLNAMRRLQRVLEKNLVARGLWAKESGYIYRVGQARIFFLSGAPEANIVGATASTLLEVDEAQDVQISKFDKDIAPMAASTNATRVFWGTAWTSNTLLARELRAAQAAEQRDGIRRVFKITADDVSSEVKAYGLFVQEQISKLGRSHPMVRTQFFSEELDATGGLFTPERIALMRGVHAARELPEPGCLYAFLLDVAGQDEEVVGAGSEPARSELSNPKRDSTALTILEVDLSTCEDLVIAAPTYRMAKRLVWTGAAHTQIYAAIKSLAEVWDPAYLVVDATGIGAGLAGFLDRALPHRVIPFTFSSASKSKLAWSFLAIIDSGRWKECADGAQSDLFFQQLSFIQYEILPGPARSIRWSVPDGTKDPATGDLVHDDLVMSAALVAELDTLEWAAPGEALLVSLPDPLAEYDKGF